MESHIIQLRENRCALAVGCWLLLQDGRMLEGSEKKKDVFITASCHINTLTFCCCRSIPIITHTAADILSLTLHTPMTLCSTDRLRSTGRVASSAATFRFQSPRVRFYFSLTLDGPRRKLRGHILFPKSKSEKVHVLLNSRFRSTVRLASSADRRHLP